ncbi:C-C chemokine receptor type 1-like isoform X2 [Gambusia affinis]|uniref:C-C chemokine receptor type 1-like isoform X2 n=1 Tax=Gambusia affinis TaxID=33528 RepID=UPI001CDC7ACB|nr:C-C chemokine receptor type 1-like isoform X2 [Gambusia affinis]
MTSINSSSDSRNFTGVPVELCRRDDDNKVRANLSYIYYFMFVFSVITNLLVVVIIYWFEKLYTVINILLLNLVASSLIFMSSLPFLAVYMQKAEWIFGSAMCKIVMSVYYLGFYNCSTERTKTSYQPSR